ncbi:MAG TPA: carboxypeptidase-like regulatory domain-containing protein, partial [Bryobacteraceae bacterium]|nr:carboxypeptidase-like regulatory domain-containing protein [Bryobacteraceae bacterium]
MESISSLSSRRENWIPPLTRAVLLLVGMAVGAVAQVATGNISGYVKDSSGAIVPNATVTAKMVEQEAVRTTKTDAEGFYSLLYLPPGQYEMTFELTGFQRQLHTGLQLTVGQNLRVDGTLQ